MLSADELGMVDVCFVIDTTSSMTPFIEEAKRTARETAERIAAEGDLDLRFAVVEYRDHPPQDWSFVERSYPFGDGDALQGYLGSLFASGGGDLSEAVFDGLLAAARLEWRPNADRRLFLIGDAPPHGGVLDGPTLLSDAWPEGCPCGATAGGVVELLGHKRIVVHAIVLGADEDAVRAFRAIAENTGGSCEAVDCAFTATASYAGTLTATAGVVSAARTYTNARTVIGLTTGVPVSAVSNAEVARFLGWNMDIATAVNAYVESRTTDGVSE